MTFANSWSSNIPAVETKGGTGNSAYVVGDILYSDATNNLARRAIGTNGHVLTVVAGVPNWAASPAAGPGTLTLLNSSTVSNVASVSWGNTIITNTYTEFLFRWRNVITDAAATTDNMILQLSTDNGATWLTASTDYNWGSSQDNTAQATGYMGVGIVGIDTERGGIGHGRLSNPTSATTYTTWESQHIGANGTNTTIGQWRWGISRPRTDATQVAHNAFQFLMLNASNLSGTFEVYGVTW